MTKMVKMVKMVKMDEGFTPFSVHGVKMGLFGAGRPHRELFGSHGYVNHLHHLHQIHSTTTTIIYYNIKVTLK